MDEKLISKKDLLEKTGITYGQLYRWKRKKLIPEEWFIRKSTYTGQETFFPEGKILERINKIIELKDSISLDELANVFSPQIKDVNIRKDDLMKRNIVSLNAIKMFEEQIGTVENMSFQMVLHIYLVSKSLETGEIGWEEGKEIIQTLHTYFPKLNQKQASLVVLRKMGVVTVLLLSNIEPFFVDDKTKIAIFFQIEKEVEALLNKLMMGGS
ncbi:hypothetical protein BKP35_04780 [Anaerobacillus arseniciselenatis]|uniref:DUF4004 domain-containing protein n=1 Tax=Anaerobacillus arseniciselenatis TaxID=85682 RepID=A0A1S2LRL9_9BACI|nr:YhbD family protein [Anaerobacillus arseniciselenatis]OIJ15169.1 hypothetical protein BKP35_04780 [Anaerobacillus arseniciselenatis]